MVVVVVVVQLIVGPKTTVPLRFRMNVAWAMHEFTSQFVATSVGPGSLLAHVQVAGQFIYIICMYIYNIYVYIYIKRIQKVYRVRYLQYIFDMECVNIWMHMYIH